MSFTEFCCRSGGSNLNAGTRTGNSTEPGTSASFTYASGNWVQSTCVFTVASGDPQADGVAAGDFASVYPDGSSVAVFIGRVTAVSTTTITVSTTIKSGTSPTNGTANRTLKIGGAWQGPNGTSGFPMSFVTSTLVASSGLSPRINYKNDATYSITANISTVNADTTHQGYTSSYGDFGLAILDGGTSGASYNLIGSTVGANASLMDFECRNNGATGSASGVFWNGTGQVVRCVFHDFRGHGLQTNNSTSVFECEAYACNQSNTANLSGFAMGGQGSCCVLCFSHDNSGTNANGFLLNGSMGIALFCVADTNGASGFVITVNAVRVVNCDCYNNGDDGIKVNIAANNNCYIMNTNLIKNTDYGIHISGAGVTTGMIINCGFGAGTQANGAGTTNLTTNMTEAGSVVYPSDVNPYVAPTTGDFRLANYSAINGGRGTFKQTQSSYTGSVSYPPIGSNIPKNPRSGGRFGGF